VANTHHFFQIMSRNLVIFWIFLSLLLCVIILFFWLVIFRRQNKAKVHSVPVAQSPPSQDTAIVFKKTHLLRMESPVQDVQTPTATEDIEWMGRRLRPRSLSQNREKLSLNALELSLASRSSNKHCTTMLLDQNCSMK
jgi:hypothetical protein